MRPATAAPGVQVRFRHAPLGPRSQGGGVAAAPPPGVVDLWRFTTDVPAGGWPSASAALTAGERAQAAAYRRPADGRRYAVARAHLRAILAGYTGCAPGEVRLTAGPHGKPELAGGGPAAGRLRFNVSHSGEVGLCAVTLGRAVGVDVEVPRSAPPDWRGMSECFLQAAERDAVRAAGGAGYRTFLRLWTLKEACLKAAGVGLTVAPETVDVAAALRGEVARVWLDGGAWLCREVPGPAGGAAALAVAEER